MTKRGLHVALTAGFAALALGNAAGAADLTAVCSMLAQVGTYSVNGPPNCSVASGSPYGPKTYLCGNRPVFSGGSIGAEGTYTFILVNRERLVAGIQSQCHVRLQPTVGDDNPFASHFQIVGSLGTVTVVDTPLGTADKDGGVDDEAIIGVMSFAFGRQSDLDTLAGSSPTGLPTEARVAGYDFIAGNAHGLIDALKTRGYTASETASVGAPFEQVTLASPASEPTIGSIKVTGFAGRVLSVGYIFKDQSGAADFARGANEKYGSARSETGCEPKWTSGVVSIFEGACGQNTPDLSATFLNTSLARTIDAYIRRMRLFANELNAPPAPAVKPDMY